MQQFYNSPQSFGISILTPSPLLSGELTFPYSVQLAAAGGAVPYLFAVVSGALPPGITLQPNGQFTGTPTSAAAYLFGVEATDARGTSSPVAQFSLTIVTAVQISTASPLPSGNQGAAYSVTLVASGGASPYSNWSLIAGSIDPGLILNPSTGVLAGTLTAAAVYTPTFQVLDALGYPAQKTFSLTVQSTTGQTATPTFSPVAGTYATAQTVALADATVGAVIYDTIDGTIPTVTTTALLTQPSINGIAGNLWVHGGTPGGNPPFGRFGLISEQSNPQTGNGSFQVNAWNAGSLTGFTPVNPSLAQLSFAPSGTFPTTTAQAEGTKVGVYLQSVDLPQPNPTTPTPKQMITPQIIFNNQVVWTSPQSIISSTLNIAVQTASGGATPPFININHSFNYAPGGTPTTQQFTLNVMIFSLGNAAPSHITPTIDTPTNSAIVAVPLGVAQAANPSNSTYLKTIAGNYSSTVFSTLFPVTYSISYAQFVTALTAARTALGATVVPSLVPSDYLMNEMHINAELHYQSGTADATLGWQMNNWAVVANSTSGTAVLYTAPLSVPSSTVINAIATAVGFTPSNIGTAAYTIGSVVQATQQIKFTVGMMMGSESGDQMSTSIASAKTEIAQMVATGPTLIYPTANRGYIMGAMARDLEDYTAATNQALLSAASGGPIGATGAALQTAIVTQYPGFRSLMEANFFYQQSQANGSLTAWWIVSNYYSPNGLTNAVITQNWTQPNVPKIVPKDLRNCGGSITVPNFYGSASSTTGTVSAIYGGSNGYGFGFSQANGGPSFSVATPAYWNPLCNQRTRKQLWQALGLYTLSNGTLSANPTTAAIAPGTAVHDGSGNAYIALGTTNVPIGTALTNTSFFMVNRWVGLTFNQCPEVAAIAWNDEYSYVFQGEVSGATVNVNPPSGATVAAFKAAHFDFVQNAALPSFPNTQVYDCLSFEFNGVDSETPAQASSRVNNNLGGAGLSAFRGWAFCNADTWANMWNLTAGFTNPNTGPCNAGVLGIANPPFPWGSGQINAVPANDLRTKIMVGQQVQGVADYSNIGGTNGTLTPNTQPLVTSILQQMAYTNCQMAFMELTDNTFVQPPTTPNPWTHYIFPAISAFNASTPFSTVMPTMNMYGPTILTGVANSSTSATITWAAITNQGTGLSIQVYRNGSAISGASGPAATFTSYTDTAFTSPDTYTLGMVNANGSGPQGAVFPITVSRPNYVGINLNNISYFSPELPFLNVFKQAYADNTVNGWLTSASGNLNTNESAYLQQDSDGYVTSLVASPTPPGGQVFTFVQVFVIGALNSPPPGATQTYPSGAYTLQFQGAGTINLTGDMTGLASSTPGIAISGTQITSTMAPGATATVTMTINPTTTGITFQITALPSPTNYIKAVSIVQSAYQANYLAGELFHPLFKAAMQPFSRIRFMDWIRTNFEDYVIKFTGSLALGATGATIASFNVTSSAFSTFPFKTGVYNWLFGNGQVIAVTCTFGSATVSFGTPLSSAVPTFSNGQAFFSQLQSWSNRPLLSNSMWSWNGIPMEAAIILCNELACDAWINIPGTVNAISVQQGGTTYATQLAQLCHDGTGAVLTGSNVTSFAGLNSSQKVYIEYLNEYWNSTFSQYNLTLMMGTPLYSGNYPVWYGSQVATIGQNFFAVYGSSAFAARVVISMSQQSTNTFELGQVMNTAGWSGGAAYSVGHIGQIHTGGYFGLDSMSSADVTTLQTLIAAGQVQAYFDLAYSNVSQGHTFSSMPAAGYIPHIATVTASDIAAVSGQPWGTLPRAIYEGGSSNSDFFGSGSAWGTMNVTAHRAANTQFLYYDPTNIFNATSTGYFTQMAAAVAAEGMTSFTVNIFADINIVSAGGDYCCLESVMQTISPLSSAPPKYAGIVNYIQA